jgi:hypothetical protein
MDLAKKENIKFKKRVNIGFKKIKDDYAIGICYYGRNFREIGIDADTWKSSSNTERTVLVWHELTHCYCNRDHDFGKNMMYAAPRTKEIEDKSKGYYPDKCPLSIMHPVLLDDLCFIMHYDSYIHEQFDRCKPY